MTMSTTTAYTFATMNGLTSQVPVAFRFLLASDLEVYVNGVLDTGYAVTGAGSLLGGAVTFYSLPVAGTKVFIRRATARSQLLDLAVNSPLNAETLELAFDRLTAQLQDVIEREGRRPALAVGTAAALRDLEFPAPAPGKVIGWNANGTALTTFDSTITVVDESLPIGVSYETTTATLTAASGSGGTQLTASSLITAGKLCLGALLEVDTEFGASGGLSALSLGDVEIYDRWGAAIPLTAGTQTNQGYFSPGALFTSSPSARDAIITAEGGTFDGDGQATLTAFYLTLAI